MKWIYLSPHLDDVIYSCGGLIWEQTNSGHDVAIWTIFAADAPIYPLSQFAETMHDNWGLEEHAVKVRREEDQISSKIVGAAPHYLSYLDCIYRKSESGTYYYQSDSDLFGGLDTGEADIITALTADLKDQLPANAQIVVPLSIGNHVDHEFTRKAASRLEIPLYYYADYPYARESEGKDILDFMKNSTNWEVETYSVSEKGIRKWQQAALAYQSQVTIFWENEGVLMREIKEFSSTMRGVGLWKTTEES